MRAARSFVLMDRIDRIDRFSDLSDVHHVRIVDHNHPELATERASIVPATYAIARRVHAVVPSETSAASACCVRHSHFVDRASAKSAHLMSVHLR